MDNLNDTLRGVLSFQLEPEVSCILEVCDEINWLSLVWQFPVQTCSDTLMRYFFSTIVSLWAFAGQSVKVTDIVCFGPEFMILNFSFCYPSIAGLFVESHLASALEDARLSGSQKVCVTTLLSNSLSHTGGQINAQMDAPKVN